MDYNLRWSEEALANLDEIIQDIERKWTEKEVERFKRKLSHLLELIQKAPFIFPVSHRYPNLRKAVLSKQTTIFYKVIDSSVIMNSIRLNKTIS